MNDKEMIELAANAAGYDVHFGDGISCWFIGKTTPWRPLFSDGDSFRLASDVGLIVDFKNKIAGYDTDNMMTWLDELLSDKEIMRRAILLAAASKKP